MLIWLLIIAASVAVCVLIAAAIQRRAGVRRVRPEVTPGAGLHTGELPPTAADVSAERTDRD